MATIKQFIINGKDITKEISSYEPEIGFGYFIWHKRYEYYIRINGIRNYLLIKINRYGGVKAIIPKIKKKGGKKMVNVNEIYGKKSKFLNFDTAKKEKLFNKKLTITNVEARDIRNKTKLIVSFKETDYTLVLNKTNAGIIAEAYGEDTEKWIGKKIKLTKTKVTFKGKLVNSILVECE